MSTLLITQDNPSAHQVPPGHPERPERLAALEKALSASCFSDLKRETARPADLTLASLVHDPGLLKGLQRARPTEGINPIDGDTFISAGSLDAVATALGAGMRAIEAVALGEVDNGFCAIRPPGHHAERARSMGFCLINNVAILARLVQRMHGAERVAIIDFDVHHGNGTQDIFENDPSVFYGSSHEMPLYPGTGARTETGCGNICNVPLDAGSGGAEMREAYTERLLPALEQFSPDFLLISAGFDAHRSDPLANLNWEGEDYGWLTGQLMEMADRKWGGRIVSVLEGGYDLEGLVSGVTNHLKVLEKGTVSPQ